MALSLTIGGRPYKWKNNSLNITENLGQRSTCDFIVEDYAGLFPPKVGEEVIILDGAARAFGGSVESVEIERFKGTDIAQYRVVCADHHRILDRRLAGEYSWTGLPAGTIITDICNNSLTGEGVDTTFVQSGPTIERFEVFYPSVIEALGSVAQLADYHFYIDYAKKLRFFRPDTYWCAFGFEDGSSNFNSLVLRVTREEYANKVVIRVGTFIRAEQTAQFDATNGRTGTGEDPDPAQKPDGIRKVFSVTYQIHLAPTVKVNGVEKTVGISGVDTGKDWYWLQGQPAVEQDSGAAALTASDVLTVAYVGTSSELISAQNDDEIFFRSQIEGGSGIYEKFDEPDKAMTAAEAQQYAGSLLNRLDELSVAATADTSGIIEPLASTARVGQQIHIDCNKYVGGGRWITAVQYGSPVIITAPSHGRINGERVRIIEVPGVSGSWQIGNVTRNTFELVGSTASGSYSGGGWFYPVTFLITSIKATDIPGYQILRYQIEAVAGPLLENALDFFRGLSGGGSTSGISGSSMGGTAEKVHVSIGHETESDVATTDKWPHGLTVPAGKRVVWDQWIALAKEGPVGADLVMDILAWDPESVDPEASIFGPDLADKLVIADGETRGEQLVFASPPIYMLNKWQLRAAFLQTGTTTKGKGIFVHGYGHLEDIP